MSDGCLELMQKSIKLNNLQDRVTTMSFKWGKEGSLELRNQYDLVIGSDIVYEAAQFEILIETIKGIGAKATYLCLTDHGNVQQFLDLLKSRSVEVEVIP